MPESDTVKIVTLICGVFSSIMLPVVGGVVTYFVWKMTEGQRSASLMRAAEAKAAAEKADEVSIAAAEKVAAVSRAVAVQTQATVQVKQDLAITDAVRDAKLDGLADVAHATHTLVNSQMGATLKAAAIALRTVADLRGKPSDIAAAEEAERLYGEHQAKQDIVDDRAATKGATVIVMASPVPPVPPEPKQGVQ